MTRLYPLDAQVFTHSSRKPSPCPESHCEGVTLIQLVHGLGPNMTPCTGTIPVLGANAPPSLFQPLENDVISPPILNQLLKALTFNLVPGTVTPLSVPPFTKNLRLAFAVPEGPSFAPPWLDVPLPGFG